MPRLFDDPEAEIRIARSIEARRQQRAAYNHTPQLAASTSAIRRETGLGSAALAFAKANRQPTDSAVLKAAEVKARSGAKGDSGTSIGDVLRGSARAAFTVLESPIQEVQGLYRNVATLGEGGRIGAGVVGGGTTGAAIGSVVPGVGTAAGAIVGGLIGAGLGALAPEPEGEAVWQPQSTGAVTLGRLASGQEVDAGSGFFAGGAVRAEHERRSSNVTIGGKSLTPGRYLASAIVEPGTTPYNTLSGLVDASLLLKFDPAALGLAKAGRARSASKSFVPEAEAAGMVKGTRNTVITERVAGWLDSRDGQKVLSKVASTNQTYDVWRLLNRKVDPAVASQLADAKSVDEVRAVLDPLLGTVIREKPVVPGVLREAAGEVGRGVFTAVARRDPSTIRALAVMPGANFRLDDVAQRTTQVERFLRNARMPSDVVARYVDRVARAETPAQVYKVVVSDMLSEVMTTLAPKVGANRAQQLTKAWRDNYRELSRYFVDEVGENIGVRRVTVAGREFEVPSPHLWNELIHSSIPSPDARAIRRITSGNDSTLQGRVWHNAVNSGVWEKGTTLLDWAMQDAWKPLTLLRGAWTVRVVGEEQVRMGASGLDSIFSHPLRAIAWATGRKGTADILGNPFDDAVEFASSQSVRGGGWRDRIATHGRMVFNRNDDTDNYVKGLQGELGQLASDPVARVVAGGPPPGSMPAGAFTGNPLEDAKRWFWAGKGSKFRQEMAEVSGKGDLLTMDGANAYIDTVFRRIEIKTTNNPDLLDAVRTGKLRGMDLADAKARGTLDTLVAEGVGPEFARGDIVLAGRPTSGSKVGGYLNQTTDFLFTALMSRPTNFLSRSPAFRQYYYQRLSELVPFMDDATRTAAIKGAEAAGADVTRMRRLAQQYKVPESNLLALDEADAVAKAFGLDRTKQLLYDLSERSQASDIARNIFPFAEAWKEVLTRWAAIGMERPQTVRRAQQVMGGARGSGFFTTDPATGEEVFNYPGTAFVTRNLLGVEAPLQGSVAALNLFSNNPFIPGVGPVVQQSVGKLIPHKPEWDMVRELVSPYGEQQLSETFWPAWSKKWRTAMADPDSDRMFGNTVYDVARYLKSTGEYSTDTPAEQERLTSAAIIRARGLYLIRGAAQFVAPSAPSPEFMAHDKEGNLVTAFALTEEYRKLQDANYETAPAEFLRIFGEDALLYMQPKTRGGFAPTDTMHDWVRSNPDLVSRFPRVYGHFAPTAEGEFNMTEYERQIVTGERDALKPDEAVRLAHARVAAAKYRTARERLPARPSATQKAWLASVREALVEEYPGYEPERFERGKIEATIRELYGVVKEPVVARTDAGKGLAKYLAARDKAMEVAKAKDLAGFGKAKQMRGVREWLREVAEAIAAEHPDFLPLYERTLEREMVDDDTPEVIGAKQ